VTVAIFQLTEEQLYRAVYELSREDARALLPHVQRMLAEASITTAQRAAALLAQVAHESAGLKAMVEEASGQAYEGRHDLGNTQPGDGPRYKGRGWIQLTGRANYARAGAALGLPLEADPALAAGPEVAARVAAWYWTTRGLNALADIGTEEAFRQMTRRINGGENGIDDRLRRWAKAKAALGA